MYKQPNVAACHIQAPYQIYRIREVIEITGLGRSTIYAYIAKGKFPKQRKLGARAVGWRSYEIFQWLAEREVAA